MEVMVDLPFFVGALLPFMGGLHSSHSYFTFIYCHFHFLLSFGMLHQGCGNSKFFYLSRD